MAGPRARSSPRRNPSPVKRGNDEPAEQAPGTSIDGSGTPTPTPAVSRAPIPYSAIEMAGTCARSSPRASINSSAFCALTPIRPPLLIPVESYSQSC